MAAVKRIVGAAQMQQALRAAIEALPKQAAAALRTEAEIEMAEAKQRTPVDSGSLRASGYVDTPVISGRKISVELGFGGAASEYAVIVHENMDAHHPVGQAKFLESVLQESAPYLADRLARRIGLDKK
jgi:hypothetical protein